MAVEDGIAVGLGGDGLEGVEFLGGTLEQGVGVVVNDGGALDGFEKTGYSSLVTRHDRLGQSKVLACAPRFPRFPRFICREIGAECAVKEAEKTWSTFVYLAPRIGDDAE